VGRHQTRQAQSDTLNGSAVNIMQDDQSINQSIQKTIQHGCLFDCRSHKSHVATATTKIQTLFVHPTMQIIFITLIIFCEKQKLYCA